jgi:hypothetical protein
MANYPLSRLLDKSSLLKRLVETARAEGEERTGSLISLFSPVTVSAVRHCG